MAVLPPDPVFNLRNIEMGPVNCVCFHQAQRLFCGTSKGAVYLWDLQTNRTPLHFTVGSSTAPVNSISHLPETLFTQQKGGIVKAWQITGSGYVLDTTIDTKHIGYCRFNFHLEDNLMICPKDENSIGIYNSDNFSLQTTLLGADSGLKLGQIMCFKHIEMSGQRYILAAYESGDFLTWDLRTGKILHNITLEECPMALDFDPISNRGIYGGPHDQLGVFSYSRNTSELIKRGVIGLKNNGINCVSIRKDQKVFCSGGWDGRIRIFSWKSLRPLAVLTEHKAAVVDISYSNDKVQLWNAPIMAASGLDGQISLWNLYN
ncbi:hypothetical protein HA402_003787 [Bradysia odoriphaga]|nr:hypothetical protein HA402_003787 [Bradysia odoriphaga]